MSMGKILIVDDDNNICELLKLNLENDGYTVTISHDGEEAAEIFNSLKPDVVLLEIMLPSLDGWQVCREIRKKSNVPIIIITAKNEIFDKILGLELGADDYVVKPFDIKEVTARIKAVSRRSGRFVPERSSQSAYKRSNMFANVEKNFIGADFDQILSVGKTAVYQIVMFLRDCGGVVVENAIFNAIKIGINNNNLSENRKKLIDELFRDVPGGTADILCPAVTGRVGDSDFDTLKFFIGLGNKLAMPILYLILSFAYVDGSIDDELAKRLDATFGLNFLVDFIQSGKEEVPKQGILLKGLEEKIAEWYDDEEPFTTFDDVCEHFPNESKSDIKKALDNLCGCGFWFKSYIVGSERYLKP